MHSNEAPMVDTLVSLPSSARPPPACPRMGQAAIGAVGRGHLRLLFILLLGASRCCCGSLMQRSGLFSDFHCSCARRHFQPYPLRAPLQRNLANPTPPPPRPGTTVRTSYSSPSTRFRSKGKCFTFPAGPDAGPKSDATP